jgi:phage tail sheath gpL-like
MAINFTYYDQNNRVPGVYVEMDPSQANTGTELQRTILLGNMTTDGTATPNEPIIVESKAQVADLTGADSILNAMASRYMDRDPFGTVYLLPLEDDAAAQPSKGKIVTASPPTTAGTVNLYIAGTRIRVAVDSTMANEDVATALNAAITTTPGLPVTTAVDGTDKATVNLTSSGKGQIFNDIDIRFDYLGTAGGEYPTPGLDFTVTPMAGGSANPDIADALANLSSEPFDFIGMPYTDTANLDALKEFLADDVGRWSWQQMIYGGGFSAYRGTLGQQTTFGLGRNDQHMSVMAFNDSPDPAWIWTAEACASSAASLRVDPGLPLQYINMTVKAPPIASRWSLGERNTLLYDGLSTFRVGDDNTVIMERMRTQYRENAAGATDNSYLDVETMYGLMFVARNMTNYLLTRYARKKLVSDATPVLYGSNCVNSAMIKASVIMNYRALETQGYVQNAATFAQNVLVENAGNGLVKILAPVDLVNQLRQIAILLQFRKS